MKELCIKYGLSGAGSKRDNIIALKDIMKVPREFVKVFDKIWGGSGKLEFGSTLLVNIGIDYLLLVFIVLFSFFIICEGIIMKFYRLKL